MKILGIHHAQIMVGLGEEEAARRFYCDVLALPEVVKPDPLRARGGFWLQVGAQQVHVNCEENPMRAKSRAHVAYHVEDLAGWKARLAAAGISVQDGEGIPGYIRCELRDPFGNRIELIQAV